MNLLDALLALIKAAPAELVALTALYDQVKHVLPASDQATVDAALLASGTKLNADVAQLQTDVAAAAAKAAPAAKTTPAA